MNHCYAVQKNNAREIAIKWQNDFNNHNFSYSELVQFQDYFTKISKRYGLVKEFKENGLI